MKIIIPMAGLGKRLRPFTLTTAKPLIKIAGKSIVQRLVEKIINVSNDDVTDVAFILGDFPEDVKINLISISNELNFNVHFFFQKQALGTAHAIAQASELLEGKVIIAFADTLFNASFKIDESKDVIIWTKKVDNPQNYGVVIKENSRIVAFKEKPQTFISDEAIIGIYYFKNSNLLKYKLDYILNNGISVNGEYQLTDALQFLLDDGLNFISQIVDDWMDCGNKDILIKTASKVLQALETVIESVYKTNNIIIEPVFIGKNVQLNNCIVGPNVSIEDNSIVQNSIIDNSMILSSAKVNNARFTNTIIGNFSNVKFNIAELAVGDYDEILY
ncbi:MAG: hypothetical protein JXR68_13780 [Bacteroidales bacterium]|nr:hypothetical protein [Bacteroidales bacterium]